MYWFTADLHLGHDNIRKYCNRNIFPSVERMDWELLKSINQYVKYNDTLYILGDLCFGRKNDSQLKIQEQVLGYRKYINCQKIILTFGNHDRRIRTLGSPYQDIVFNQFRQLLDTDTIRINEQRIYLSHYAHAIWNCRHYGYWHLYGHSHGMAEDWLDLIMPERFSMDVGVDNAYKLFGEYRPISFEEISEIMSKRKGFGLLKWKR